VTTRPEPTLRERQAQEVRDGLRAAFVRLVVERGPHGFALADVASAAGVSERTLYRYYPSREALISGVIDTDVARFDEERARRLGDPGDLDNPELMAESYALFAEHAELIEASRLLRTAHLDEAASYRRTEALRDLLADHIPPAALEQVVGVVRALTGSDVWLRLREPDIDLDDRAAGHAVQWAVQVLIREAARADGAVRPMREWRP
jgi:AcrR family transcriptional regulator